MQIRLAMCLHNHQPVGNFDEVVEKAYQDCYLPLLEHLERHPGVRLGLHYSGCLLDWIEAKHPDHLARLRGMCVRGQVELLTSGFYEPILPVFPRQDVRRQVKAFSARLARISGGTPRGMWLTERVWEPSMPSILEGTGVEYAVVDDNHLALAGLSPGDCSRPWLTEDSGVPLRLLGSMKRLRYAIPFHSVQDVMSLLGEMAERGAPLAFYGDDGEKFGVWPGTRDLCYGRGWLEEFLSSVEGAGWIRCVTPSEACDEIPAGGPVYVPTASYPEMGEWTIPANAREEYGKVVSAVTSTGIEGAPSMFLRGGFWRNFLTRYPEANELHKRVLHSYASVAESRSADAMRHYWRSQCNCSYWHGVFGGLYLPHLREAVWIELHEAERAAHDRLGDLPVVHRGDIDSDGSEEILVITPRLSVLVRAGDGLSISELTILAPGRPPVPLGHVLTRRTEAYHSLVSDETAGSGVRTIHDALPSTEAGLASRVVADPWRRVSFRSLAMPRGDWKRQWLACSNGIMAFQCLPGTVAVESCGHAVSVSAELEALCGRATKRIVIGLSEPFIECRTSFDMDREAAGACEVCMNLLAGSEPDRSIRVGSARALPVGRPGGGRAARIEIRDLWRGAEAVITSPRVLEALHMPLESVNRSERGYERVHQGLALVMAQEPGARTELVLRLELSLS